MLKAKKIVYLIIGLFVLIVALLFLDWKTTYLVEVQQEDVQVFNEQIVIEMSSGTSMGYFKEAKLEEIEPGIYRIEAYYSLLSGENSGYLYEIDNSNHHIREIRQYHLDYSNHYTVIFQNHDYMFIYVKNLIYYQVFSIDIHILLTIIPHWHH